MLKYYYNNSADQEITKIDELEQGSWIFGYDIDAEEILDNRVAGSETKAGVSEPTGDKPSEVEVADEADELGEIDLGDGMSIRDSQEIENDINISEETK